LLLEQLRTQQAAFLVVALVALAIAALGMLNIGLASVSERARELVIRRAVGATRADILGQMLVSSIVVGVAVAAVAVDTAWIGVQWWVPQLIAPSTAITPPGLPWAAVSWGLVAAISTTVAGSLLPAVVAARLDVATALRD
jgi:putative ABC transport system permease protein